MSDEKPLVNIDIDLGKLTEPVTKFVDRVADYFDARVLPGNIKRTAKAEAEAAIIKARSDVKISDIERRAIRRWLVEEEKHQRNIEQVVRKAIPHIVDDSKAEDISEDWIASFFADCRIVSDDEMQTLWGKILAGEANHPGSFSKRTLQFVMSLEKYDAELFTDLCRFGWMIGGFTPVIFNTYDKIYQTNNITFDTLKHLDEIGLLTHQTMSSYGRKGFPKEIVVGYGDERYLFMFGKDGDNSIEFGEVLLSRVGLELAPISGAKPIDGFADFAIAKWMAQGVVVASPLSRDDQTTNG